MHIYIGPAMPQCCSQHPNAAGPEGGTSSFLFILVIVNKIGFGGLAPKILFYKSVKVLKPFMI